MNESVDDIPVQTSVKLSPKIKDILKKCSKEKIGREDVTAGIRLLALEYENKSNNSK